MHKDIEKALTWRYATKVYDKTKSVQEADLETILEAVRMTPTSFGLQPFKVVHVKDVETREKLKAAAWNQSQVTDSAHFFVFSAITNLDDKYVDEFVENIAKTRGVEIEALKGYSDMMKGSVNGRSAEENINWAKKQAYIALGFALETAALLGIDATPMEGFDPKQFNEILGLKEKNLTSAVMLSVGYRKESEDSLALAKKVRLSKEKMFVEM